MTYVDRLSGGGFRELQALLDGPFAGLFGGIHLLPFFWPIDGADATLVDADGALARKLGFRAPGFVVVRPDGYLGLFADARATSLRDWLFLVEAGVPSPEHAIARAS